MQPFNYTTVVPHDLHCLNRHIRCLELHSRIQSLAIIDRVVTGLDDRNAYSVAAAVDRYSVVDRGSRTL